MEYEKAQFTDKVFDDLIGPFLYPIMGMQRIYWFYLLTSLTLALVVYLSKKRKRDKGVSGRRFFEYAFPKSVYLHKSAITDYKYFIINRIILAIFITPALLGIGVVAGAVQTLLISGFGEFPETGEAGLWLVACYTLLGALVFDFSVFIAHYLQHKIPLLWEFHKVHHSAEVLTPMTVYRMHPVDDILSGTIGACLLGLLEGVVIYFYPAGIKVFTFLQLNIVIFLFYFVGYNLRHTHIWLSYGPFLSRVFISPAQHQIHHSLHKRHWDKNMGFIFAFWDGFFGTLYIPKDAEEHEIEFGLGNGEEKEFYSVSKCYLYPFKKARELLLKRKGSSG